MPVNVLPIGESKKEHHKLLGLDHLRALAIVSVLLFHYQFFGHPAWVEKVGSFGWTGVDLFFVLSGFLIAGQLFGAIAKGKSISMKEFFIKRFFRIIPPYLVMVALYAAIPYLREREHFAPLWRYLTFTLNFGFDLRTYGTFTHAWSLCVEEQFYFILPLIFWLFSYFKLGKEAIYLIIALFVAGFTVRLWSWYHLAAPYLSKDDFGAMWNKYIYYPTYNRLDGLLVGVSIAGLFTFYPAFKDLVNKYSNVLMAAGIALLITDYFIATPQDTFITVVAGFPLISLAYGLIVASIVCTDNVLYTVSSVITSRIATLSYSIYLIHKLMIHLTQGLLSKMGIDKNSNLMMLLCLLSIIAGALLLRYIIEKPSLRIRDKVLHRLKHKETVKVQELNVS